LIGRRPRLCSPPINCSFRTAKALTRRFGITMWRTTAVVGALCYSRHVRDSRQHVANQMTAAHYITILRKVQILNPSAVNLEQSVSKVVDPFLIRICPYCRCQVWRSLIAVTILTYKVTNDRHASLLPFQSRLTAEDD
jgi:hypothetical protein